jgi:hypothetical protein
MHAEKDASPRREEVDDCRLMRENCWGFGWGKGGHIWESITRLRLRLSGLTFSQPPSEGRNCRTIAPSHAPYECKSGIRLTTFPSFRAWTFNFSSSPEPVHRSGGVRFSVAQ